MAILVQLYHILLTIFTIDTLIRVTCDVSHLPKQIIMVTSANSIASTPSQDSSAHIEGDIILGGLFMVHSSIDNDETCGQLQHQMGVQALEAMFYAVDLINENKTILPGFTLGVRALDDCNQDAVALEQSVEFIRGRLYDPGGDICSGGEGGQSRSAGTTSDGAPKTPVGVAGVVGAASSMTSIQVANLLKLFKIPQVSYWATSPDLSNKNRFPYFLRTVPSDHYQARAMIDIVRHFNWSYVSIVHENSNYGIQGTKELTKLARKYGICIAVTAMFEREGISGNGSSYDEIMTELWLKKKARAVIVWGSEKDASGLFSAASRISRAAEHFVWIGSDFWSGRQLATLGNEAVIEGAITVQPLAETIPEFDEYFTSLNPSTNERNPWFQKFWAEHFNCVWLPSTNDENTRMCNGSEKISLSSGYRQDPLIQFIVDAVLAFAHALKAMHAEYCGSDYKGLCTRMKQRDVGSLLRFLKNVSFQGGTGEPFKFTKELDGPVRYKILNYQRVGPGKYRYIDVGSYKSEHLKLDLDRIYYRPSVNQSGFPDSMCGTPCSVGEMRYMLDDQCCWLCMKCDKFEYLQDEETCDSCPVGFVPNLTRDGCNEVPVSYLRPDSEGAISAVALSSLGEIATIFVALVFAQYKNTPVVKASGRELSGILLLGIFLCYLLTYLLLAPPTLVSCAVQQFSVGVAFSTCYAALLVKTNRVYRIFTSGKSTTKRPSFISPTSQILITAILIAIEVVLSASWLIALPARAIKHYPSHSQVLLVCNGFLNSTSLLSLAYPLILLILCTAYAFKTRKIPGHFNEAKCIGLTTYTSCVIWLAMVPIYVLTSANIELRIITLYFAISLSATVCLVCLFAPRVYVILFRPERNIRSSTSFVGSRGKGVKGQSKTGLNVPNNLSLNANSINANSSIINVDSKSSKSDDPDGPKEEML